MTHYLKGRRAEWLVRDYFKALGYYVIRAAGSKGAADLIATSPGRIHLIQVKTGRKPCGKEFRAEKDALGKLLYEWPSDDVRASIYWQVKGHRFVEWYRHFGEHDWIEAEVDLGGDNAKG